MIWWPFGDATRRGAVRAFVAATFWWCGATVYYWASYLAADPAGPATRAWKLVAWIAVALTLAWFALVLTVMFFNWPKFVVPPPQRGEPGAVAEWRNARRASRPDTRRG